ncbi:MAG: DUF5924 family protein [Acidobacteria bacterium]|nr:DUF5924 family protein [Acidobacteriota bacterium]
MLHSLRERTSRFWERHRALIWILHSAWALMVGTTIVLVARDRYYLVLWVVVFLVLAWALTLFFGRAAAEGLASRGRSPGLVHEVSSYVTRVLYQQTLFFLLPFYAYSTVIGSPNVVFLGLLGGLAVLSCIDLVFDRWLRTRPVFALAFFAVVAFAAINLLLPLLVGLPPRVSAPIAALLAVGGAAPLALRTMRTRFHARLWLVGVAVVILIVPIGLPGVIPPVPLRMQQAAFASGIDRQTLDMTDTFLDGVTAAKAGRALFVRVGVFSPTSVPATVQLEWWRDSELLRVTREIAITANAASFRVWDAWRPTSGAVAPGLYRVVLRTVERQVFGIATLRVDE